MTRKHQLGDIINQRYCINSILGKGSVGITYGATDTKSNQQVAIKAISLKQLDDWKQVELLQREALVLTNLEHSGIPKYLDYFDIESEKDKVFYLVQELIVGQSLFQLIESGWHATELEVKQIAEQILSILDYLHSLKPPVIHRDIKPQNLILNDEGKVFLEDFGAVQNIYYNILLKGSTVVGTYGYIAPEQFRGKAEPATDLYSLGATLLYLLTHRSPTELPQNNLKIDFRSQVNISESFVEWLEKILEPDPEDRFSSAQASFSELHKKLLTRTRRKAEKILIGGLVVFLLGVGVNTFNFNKWKILSSFGYYPFSVCHKAGVMKNYIERGGRLDIKVNNTSNITPANMAIDISKQTSLANCIIETANEQVIQVIQEKSSKNKRNNSYTKVLL
ncbi:MAG: serine/threonine protein kinase, partial [Xenococcus sp. (in: cyanobacteria)]